MNGLVIKKTQFTLWSVCNNDTLGNSSDTQILHAIQNVGPWPSSDSSILSYSLTSKVSDQAHMGLEGNGINWKYDSFSILNA